MMTGLAPVLLALIAQAPQQAAPPRDTLVYNVALMPADPHLTVEARLTNARGGPVILVAPPAARRAGTTVAGFAATDDRGVALTWSHADDAGAPYVIQLRGPGAIRFRYRLDFRDRIAEGSTGSGFDSLRIYATTSSVFIAPDPTEHHKTGEPYPFVRVEVYPPPGWQVISGFQRSGTGFEPKSGEELLGSTIAAAPDFRVYRDSAGGAPVLLAIRGRRYFSDSQLGAVVRASLRKGSELLGPVPVERVTYTSDLGRKGRTSGSLQGIASIGLIWEPGEILDRARAHDTFHETLHLWFGGVMETERWWTEGVTDYFAARLLASWHDDPADLAALCYDSYQNYLAIPHHTRMTMAQEAHQGMAGDNTELLVYRKGMLTGLMLDAAIRHSSNGRASLDDVARRLLGMAKTRHSKFVRESELRDAVRAAGGAEAGRVWDRVVSGTTEITGAEVHDALRQVTGRDFPVPPSRQKDAKWLTSEGAP